MIDYDKLPRRDILCIDVKSFFASVEAVRRKIHPLKAYLIVISNFTCQGAVVLASSPLVKKEYGIKTGNRKFEIPDDDKLILVEPSMATYLKVNGMIVDIFKRYVSEDDLHVYSIDESFLDVSSSKSLFGDAYILAKRIQKEIWNELRLVVSVGIGDNPLLAKLALDNEAKYNRDQIAYWGYEHVSQKIWKISSLTAMWGISKGYERQLNAMGIYSVYDLAHASKEHLQRKMGIMGLQLYYHSHGVDYSRLSEGVKVKNKSYGKGQTLMHDYECQEEILVVLSELVEDVSARLRSNQKACACLSLQIRLSRHAESGSFRKDYHLSQHTHCTHELVAHFRRIFIENWKGSPVRQLYVSLSDLVDVETMQMDFFSFFDNPKFSKVDDVMDSLRRRYGKTCVFKGTALSEGSTFKARSSFVGGHKGNSKVNERVEKNDF